MLAIKYCLFAIVSIGVNLVTQMIVIELLDYLLELYVALLLGTATGLFTKYELDRLWIFSDKDMVFNRSSKQFLKYSALGLITTLVFWGFELGFHYWLSSPYAKYVGGGLGLAIGYWLKYQLDKKYVFVRPATRRA